MEASRTEPTAITKSTKPWSVAAVDMAIIIRNSVKRLIRSIKGQNPPHRSAEGDMDHTVYPVGCPSEIRSEASCLIQAKRGINRITPEMYKLTDESILALEAIELLDMAINFHQSNCIVKAREKLQIFLGLMKNFSASKFVISSKYGWEVVNRGKDIFFDGDVSCSVKHGIILLDASNVGAQFYAALLSILGAFALEVSEFQIAHEAYSLLIDVHGESKTTSRLRDLGAAYNNKGCISLAMGDFSQAKDDFKNAQRHLRCKRHKQHDLSLQPWIIVVESNNNRLDLMTRNYAKCLKEQEKLVQVCKTKQDELPAETIFVVMHNQAVLHTTLGNFSKAEKELRWGISYCKTLRRDDCDFLLNFVALHLHEVLLLRGKPEEAELVCPSEALTATNVCDLMPLFGGLHLNLKVEALEKLVDIFVKRGKIKVACDLLKTGLKLVNDTFGPCHFNVALFLYKQASMLKLTGDYSESMKKFKRSAEILRGIFGEKHPLLIKCYMSLGEVAFELGRSDESYIYFQRAVENVEVIFNISYPAHLSVRYIEITTDSKYSSCEIGAESERNKEQGQRIEGLVAEYGLALAVLSSQIKVRHVPQIPTTKGKQPLHQENIKVPFTESSLISQKCARDLLQSGQVLLRQGMTKEAASFFQLASKYCQAQQVAQNIPDLSIIRLYTVFSQTNLNTENKGEINVVLKRTLEEITMDSGINGVDEEESEKTDLLASHSELNLKLVLILLILLCMQLKMYDITSAAYDLYVLLSTNDSKMFLSLNHGLQFYASRISVTCNGKTAVQDFLVSSVTGLVKDDSELHLPGRPLFKSLAVRKNMPTNRMLVTYRATSFPDIDDLTRLEEKTLRSFQELMEVNSLDSEVDSTQVFVDLTSTASFECKSLLTSSGIGLLPICLIEGETEEENDAKQRIVEKFPGICEKITHMTFSDEPTSWGMFSRIGIWLFQQCNSGRISTLQVRNQCLALTVTAPFKVRITLSCEGRSIYQSMQVISAANSCHLSEESSPQHSCTEGVDRSLCSRAFERFSAAAVLQWAKAREMAFETTVVLRRCSHSFGPSTVSPEANGIRLNFLETETGTSPLFIQEAEEYQGLIKSSERNLLECLTAISEISRQLFTDEVSQDTFTDEQNSTQIDHFSKVRAAEHINSGPFSRYTVVSQHEDVTTSSKFSLAACDSDASSQRQNVLLRPCLSSVSQEANHPSEEDEDANALGRRLFEQDRKSRNSSIAKIQEDLKRKETSRQIASLQYCRDSSNETPEDSQSSEQGHSLHEADYDSSGRNYSFSKELLQICKGILPRNKPEPSGASDENVWSKTLPTNEEVGNDALTLSRSGRCEAEQISNSAEIVKEKDNKMIGTGNLPLTPNDGLEIAVRNRDAEVSQGKSVTRHFDHNQMDPHEQRHLEKVVTISEESEDFCQVERDILKDEAEKDYMIVERYEKQDRRKSATLGKEDASQTRSEKTGVYLVRKTLKLVSQGESEEEPYLEGGWDKHFDNFSAHDSDMRLRESGMKESKEGNLNQDNVKLEDQESQLILRKKNHDWGKAKCSYSFLDSDFLTDCNIKNGFSQQPPPAPITAPDSVLKGYRDRSEIGLSRRKTTKCGQGEDGFKMLNGPSSRLFDAGDVVDGNGSSSKANMTAFGGARPKTKRDFRTDTKLIHSVVSCQSKKKPIGLDPGFVARHAVINSPLHVTNDYLNCNGATRYDPMLNAYGDHQFSATFSSNICGGRVQRVFCDDSLQTYRESKTINLRSPADKDSPGESSNPGQCVAVQQKTELKQDESWHFPPPTTAAEKYFSPTYSQAHQSSVTRNPCSGCPYSQDKKVSTTSEFKSRSAEYGYSADHSTDNSHTSLEALTEDPGNTYEDYVVSLLAQLKGAMTRTVRIVKHFARTENVETHLEPGQNPEKVGVQEQSQGGGENEHIEMERDTSANEEEAISQQTDGSMDAVSPVTAVPRTPIQETPKPVCGHYQRRCLVKFPCCGNFYPCHRCHNDSQECSEDQARAINATHIRCTICYNDQAIDEGSQTYQGCNSKMSAYFCVICKHFPSVDKNPFHCEKCGICRIHKDKSFHCGVCNVCLYKRLEGKRKCRPDSGHDECCICLEDAFSGCQILPCSHKVHKDCAIAMIQNGVRKCPICRHPLFQQPNNSNQ